LRLDSPLQDQSSQILRVFDHSPDAIVIHQDFKLVYANAAARRLFKADCLGREVIGMTVFEWVAPSSLESVSTRIPLLYAGHSLPLTEQTHLAVDGTPVEVEVAAAPIMLRDLPAAVVTLRDIRERKQAERALRESEARYRELFEHYRAMVELSPAAVTIHQDYRWVFANSATAAILGVSSADQLIGRAVLDFTHPRDRPLMQQRLQRLYVERVPMPPVEIEFLRADGSTVYMETQAVPVMWQGRPAAEAVAHDITERKRTEHALREYADRLQGLSRRLMEVEETERRRIHHELHDRIGQNLSALILALDLVRTQLHERACQPIGKRVDDMQALLTSTTTQVRDLLAELHPPGLNEFGLFAALRSYVDTFHRSTSLNVCLRGEETPRLPRAAELALFRIAQEALINSAKHASAKRVEIKLEATADKVLLSVEDDGQGFDPGDPGNHCSWGLTIMRDRAEAVGARLQIRSGPGTGTAVLVAVPRGSP
jgi:PAS domain S-box-containing protein